MKKLSPRQAAVIWKHHRGVDVDQAVITVESLGRYDKFFLRNGVMVHEQDAPRFHFLAQGQWNGLCWCCGQVYTATIISRLGAPDPGAGEEITREELETMPVMINENMTYIAAPYAATHACPECAANNGLRTGTLQVLGQEDHKSMIAIETRDHPELARFKENPVVMVTIRTRTYEMGYAPSILIKETYRDDPRIWDYELNVEEESKYDGE